MASFDLIVVGAGVIGAAIAREATRAGLRVLLLEDAHPGGGVTAAGMGHVVVMDDSPAQLALSAYSRALWRAEEASLPAVVEYTSQGTLWVAADEDELAECHNKVRLLAQAGVDAVVLSPRELMAEEPNLRAGLAGGLLVPEDGICYPPAAAAHFVDCAVAGGATHLQGRVVAAHHGRVTLEDGSTHHGEGVVLATGADSSLLPELPLERRKGHLLITERYPGFARHQLLELGYLKSAHGSATESVAFNIQPRRTGQMLIGSSRQFGQTSPVAEPAMLSRMLQRAIEYMPAIDRLCAVRVWTGFRAATPDKLPLIGPATPWRDDPTLWLAMGFEGLGVTNAPGGARVLLSQMLGQPCPIDVQPYLPARWLSVPRGPAPETAHA